METPIGPPDRTPIGPATWKNCNVFVFVFFHDFSESAIDCAGDFFRPRIFVDVQIFWFIPLDAGGDPKMVWK